MTEQPVSISVKYLEIMKRKYKFVINNNELITTKTRIIMTTFKLNTQSIRKELTIEQIQNKFLIQGNKTTAESKILTVLGHLVANNIEFNGMKHNGSNYFFTLYLSFMDFDKAKDKLIEIENLYFVKNDNSAKNKIELFIY